MTKYWIGVASRDRARMGMAGGFCQLCHGKAAPMRRLKSGDRIIYYSPRANARWRSRSGLHRDRRGRGGRARTPRYGRCFRRSMSTPRGQSSCAVANLLANTLAEHAIHRRPRGVRAAPAVRSQMGQELPNTNRSLESSEWSGKCQQRKCTKSQLRDNVKARARETTTRDNEQTKNRFL